MGLQLPGKPLQESLKEFVVQVPYGIAGQGPVGREGPLHQVLERGLRLAAGEAEEGAVGKEGQVTASPSGEHLAGVAVAPGAAPLPLEVGGATSWARRR
ncbi:hypothetical protein TthSNM33_21630 (plasmid) [Thermus thermophilus]|nr:hypothetical protein TthSNM33_21630 [Thermus thermophilus]